MTQDKPVLVSIDRDTGIARITFNRPEVLNAIDVASARAFLAAAREVTADPAVRCILLSGKGRAFLAGGDIVSFGSKPEQAASAVNALLDPLHPAILALRSSPAPVVAAVRGAAAGAGLSLALSADFVVAAPDARFVMAYDKIGATPDCGGVWFLQRRVGRARAFEIMLLGSALDAGTAREYGIVNEVADDVEARADEIAARIASGPTQAYGAFKALMDTDMSLARHLEAERDAFIRLTDTADFREGVSAFLDKRKPQFRGQ